MSTDGGISKLGEWMALAAGRATETAATSIRNAANSISRSGPAVSLRQRINRFNRETVATQQIDPVVTLGKTKTLFNMFKQDSENFIKVENAEGYIVELNNLKSGLAQLSQDDPDVIKLGIEIQEEIIFANKTLAILKKAYDRKLT